MPRLASHSRITSSPGAGPSSISPVSVARRAHRVMRSTSRTELALFVRAVAYCCGVRLALWLLPSATLLRFVRRRVDACTSTAPCSSVAVGRIAWAVRAAGRRVPASTCLVEALAVQLLLARFGHRSELKLGVARDASQKFIAHAWVEWNGRIVVGARRGMRYTGLPDLGQKLG